MNIDHIYIINLEYRTDRKANILNELNKQKISNYTFINGVIVNEQMYNDWNKKYLNVYNSYSKGSLGCLLAHYNTIKDALEKGYNNILILEDDTIFKDNLNIIDRYIEEFNKQSNGEIDMLYLSGTHDIMPKKITDNIYKVYKTLTTNTYILTRKVMEYIIQNIEGYDREIDTFYAEKIQPIFNCYVIIPHITKQYANFSNIHNIHTDYKLNDKF